MRLTSNMEYLIVPKGTKFMGSGKLGLTVYKSGGWGVANNPENMDHSKDSY